MQRFFFRILDDGETEDPEGEDLDSLAAARVKTIAYARDLAAEEVREGRIDLNHRIIIEDADHDPLLTVTYGEAFAIKY